MELLLIIFLILFFMAVPFIAMYILGAWTLNSRNTNDVDEAAHNRYKAEQELNKNRFISAINLLNKFKGDYKIIYKKYENIYTEVCSLLKYSFIGEFEKMSFERSLSAHTESIYNICSLIYSIYNGNSPSNPFNKLIPAMKDSFLKTIRSSMSTVSSLPDLEICDLLIKWGIKECADDNKFNSESNFDEIVNHYDNNYKVSLLHICEGISKYREIVNEEIKKIQSLLESNTFSTNRKDYKFENEDYKRNNTKDRLFYQEYKGHLFSIYDNKCACCGQRTSLEVDHFVFPKCYGGNFIMQHNDGYLVSNAVPLCKQCNVRKLDHDYAQFYTSEQIANILKLNDIMTAHLNKVFKSDEQFTNCLKQIKEEMKMQRRGGR